MNPIYLDHHATTPCDPRVLAAMLPYFLEKFGNPASLTNVFGRVARDAVENARLEVATLLGGRPSEITFTSGATESLNLAFKGLWGLQEARTRVVISAVEHSAVHALARWAERLGATVVELPVDAEGRVAPEALSVELRAHAKETALVAVMLANNEVGTVQPIGPLAEIAGDYGVPFLCDAVQGVGKVAGFSVATPGLSAVTLSGHKFNGPKGIGVLWLRGRPPLIIEPVIHGGGQERDLRSGTLAVPLIVAMGEASRLLALEGPQRVELAGARRDALWRALSEGLGARVRRHTPATGALTNNLNVSFDGVESGALMARLPWLAFSAASACQTGGVAPSHVLAAMGRSPRDALSAARFGVDHTTTPEEIGIAAAALIEAVLALRQDL